MIRKMLDKLIEWRKARLLRKSGFAAEIDAMAQKSEGWHELMYRAVTFDTSVMASRVMLLCTAAGAIYAWSILPSSPNWPHAAAVGGLLLILSVSEFTIDMAVRGMSQTLVGRAQVFERSVELVRDMSQPELRMQSLSELLGMYHNLWSVISASMSARKMPETITEVEEIHELVTVLAQRAATAARDEEYARAFRWLTHRHADRRTALWARAIAMEMPNVSEERTLATIREAIAENPQWEMPVDRSMSSDDYTPVPPQQA